MSHNLRQIQRIVVHHSASDPRTTDWKSVRRWHIARFKLGIGYHRILEYDGACFDGRRVQVRGAHAPPNAGRIGILAMGWNGNEKHPEWKWSEAQWASLFVELRYQLERHPLALICGHNDTKATLCPGLELGKELKHRGFPTSNLMAL